MSEKREPWIDAARGLLIILVVLGHAFGTACHLASDGVAAHVSQMIYKSIYMFHMPAFFVLAGVTWSAGRDGFLRYLEKKALRLLIPYFVFGLLSIAVYFVCQVLGIGLGASSNGYYGAGACNSLASELLRLVRGDACSLNSPLWFLPCMFVVEVLYYWLSRFLPSKKWCQVWVTLVMLLTSYALIGMREGFLPEWWTRVPMFLAMLMIGRLVVDKRGFALFKAPKKEISSLVALGAVAYFALCWNLPWEAECRGVLAYLGYRALAIVGAVVVFILSQNFVKDGLCYVGFSSMGILVLHKLPLATLQLKVNFISQIEGLKAIVAIFGLCLMVTALCIVFASLIKRFVPIALGDLTVVYTLR